MPSYICDASGTFLLTKCDHFLSFSSVYLGILLDMMLNGLKGLCDSEEMCLCVYTFVCFMCLCVCMFNV